MNTRKFMETRKAIVSSQVGERHSLQGANKIQQLAGECSAGILAKKEPTFTIKSLLISL
jgi:hypothetical protein